MAKASASSKKTAAAPAVTPSRIIEGVTVRELFRLSRQMGFTTEQFERLSGASTSKLRRGRGGDSVCV